MQTKNKVTKLKIIKTKDFITHNTKNTPLKNCNCTLHQFVWKRPTNSKKCSRANASSILHVVIREHNDNHNHNAHKQKIHHEQMTTYINNLKQHEKNTSFEQTLSLLWFFRHHHKASWNNCITYLNLHYEEWHFECYQHHVGLLINVHFAPKAKRCMHDMDCGDETCCSKFLILSLYYLFVMRSL